MSDTENKPTSVPLKKQSSYTYWVDEKNKSRQLPPDQRPQKLQGPISTQKVQNGPSAWNGCGTWEQKKIALAQIQEIAKQNIRKLLQKKEQTEITLDSISLQGQATHVFKRNKWHVMYEITGSVVFKKQDKEGKFKIIDMTDNGDREYTIKGAEQVKSIIKKYDKQIATTLQQSYKGNRL